MNDTHQQPSRDWEEEFEKLYNHLLQPLGVDGQHVANKMQMRTFIQSLLTSHSEAIRERVEDWVIDKQKGMWNGDRHNPVLEQVVNVHQLLADLDNILALLNDSE